MDTNIAEFDSLDYPLAKNEGLRPRCLKLSCLSKYLPNYVQKLQKSLITRKLTETINLPFLMIKY